LEHALGINTFKISHERIPDCPSVSKILSATMPEESRKALEKWEKQKIAELGLDGFAKLKEDTFQRGKTLHSVVESYMETNVLCKPSELEDEVSKRHIVSVSQLIRQFSNPLALESAVVHPTLNYCGIIDCVAVMGKTLVLVDWKTSERAKGTTASLYDQPLQVAAYVGAINMDDRYKSLGNIETGALVVVYNSGYPAVVHTFDKGKLVKYWKEWCNRIDIFKSTQ